MFVNFFPFVFDNVFVFIYSHWLCQDWCFTTDWWFCVVPISSPPDSIHLSVDGVGVLCEASRTRLLSCWESRKVNPLLYPHSSHLTHTLSFLFSYLSSYLSIYPVHVQVRKLCPSPVLKWAFLDIDSSGLSGFSFIISYSLHDTEHNFRPFHWNFTTFTFSSSSTLYCNFSLIFSFLFFCFPCVITLHRWNSWQRIFDLLQTFALSSHTYLYENCNMVKMREHIMRTFRKSGIMKYHRSSLLITEPQVFSTMFCQTADCQKSAVENGRTTQPTTIRQNQKTQFR